MTKILKFKVTERHNDEFICTVKEPDMSMEDVVKLAGTYYQLNMDGRRIGNTNEWDVTFRFCPVQGVMHFIDTRPWYKRWWSAIKFYWFKNSNPELWED